MLGQPALVACLVRGNPQGVAFLAQQRVAAIARTVGLDRELFREVHDETAFRIELANRMKALHEMAFLFDPRQGRRTHAGHDAHVGNDVGRVGDLDATARQRRADRTHAVGDDIHRAATHAAVEQRVDLGMRIGRRHPVVVGAGVVAVTGAHEGKVLDARDVVWVGAVQPAVGMGPRIERMQRAVGLHLFDQRRVLGVAAIAPVDRIGLG